MSHNRFVYLDDGISGHRDKVSAQAASLVQRSDLSSSVSFKTKASHVGSMVGFLINTIQHIIQVPEAKLAKLKCLLESLILDGFSTPRELARATGFITSMSLAVGPIARLFTRLMHFSIQSRSSWDASFVFSEALLQELKFWVGHIDAVNGYSIRGVFGAINSASYTDASDFAFGGYLATLDGDPVRGMFEPADINTSPIYRELKAVFYVLQSYAAKLEGQKVKVFVDNMGVSLVLKVGSSKPHLQKVAVDIFRLCFALGISLDSQWLPPRRTFVPIY